MAALYALPTQSQQCPDASAKELRMIHRIIGLVSRRYVFRDAVTGLFVSKSYALLHPSTTVREHIA